MACVWRLETSNASIGSVFKKSPVTAASCSAVAICDDTATTRKVRTPTERFFFTSISPLLRNDLTPGAGKCSQWSRHSVENNPSLRWHQLLPGKMRLGNGCVSISGMELVSENTFPDREKAKGRSCVSKTCRKIASLVVLPSPETGFS